MSIILRTLEKETSGKCFGSHRYSVDMTRVAPLDYDGSPKIVFKDRGETEKQNNSYINLTHHAKLISSQPPLIKFFLDGSRRTYKVDDIAYGDKVFPIIAGQVGIGCCRRDFGNMAGQALTMEIVIAVPACANKDGRRDELFFNTIAQKINELEFLKKRDIKISAIIPYITNQNDNFEDKAVAKIQDFMIKREKEMVAELVKQNLLSNDFYLLKDGSLEYNNTVRGDDYLKFDKIRNNYSHVIGVSKSFNPEAARTATNRSIAKTIAMLPVFHRTPAYMCSPDLTQGENFSVWYVRIRDRKLTNSPFDGILKVEKLLVSEKEKKEGLNSDAINNISANLINERNPVCYGADERWPNHLYPVFLTESYVKSKYLSTELFLNIF